MEFKTLIFRLKDNLNKVLIGKDTIIEKVIVALLSRGHVLLEDVPGVGKTLLTKALAKSIDADFKRIQCTPDLLPSDILGTNIFNSKKNDFEFLPGPIFTNILLIDEINRATPRTQSSLLEAMEEGNVTIDGKKYELPNPFFVISTQNPQELYGTFPLPNSQMDRFMFSLSIGYPDIEHEKVILEKYRNVTSLNKGLFLGEEIIPFISLEQIKELQKFVFNIHVSEHIEDYIVRIVAQTRKDSRILLGASPRASIFIMRASQVTAMLKERDYVIPDDVKEVTPYILSHRLTLSQNNTKQNVITIIYEILNNVPVE